MGKKKGSFYAVPVGRVPGVYRTWGDTKKQVDGFPSAMHKKFLTEEEAQDYVNKNRLDQGQQAPWCTDVDVNQLGQRFESITVGSGAAAAWVNELRGLHGDDLVAFCAGSATPNENEKGTAACAVFFPLEERSPSAGPTDIATNYRADCVAALVAVQTANQLDPDKGRELVIYTNCGNLVSAMAGPDRWIDDWQQNGWRKKPSNKSVFHQDIYNKLLEAEDSRTISWHLVDKKKAPKYLTELRQQPKTKPGASPTLLSFSRALTAPNK